MAGVSGMDGSDVDAIVDLWQRAFERDPAASRAKVRAYFVDLFCDGPLVAADLPSLVARNDAGRITGFLGVLCRRMVHEGVSIRAAVATQLIAEPGPRNAFVPFQLLRRFLAGPQDLSLSDGANDLSERIWGRLGGQAARLYSMEWQRTLRPVESLAGRLAVRAGAPPWLGALVAPALEVIDSATARVRRMTPHGTRVPVPVPHQDATAAELCDCLLRSGQSLALRPDLEVQTLEWVLRKTAESRRFGELRRVEVTDDAGSAVGCAVFFAEDGNVAQVLALGALAGHEARVVERTLHQAYACGATEARGQLDPQLTQALSDAGCRFVQHNLGVLVHSRRPGVLEAIHRGDARLSRLDGEWWSRLGIDRRLPDW
ncbi:MAG: hypothetical protein WKG00_20960 [Polyangiaceae bacterium]